MKHLRIATMIAPLALVAPALAQAPDSATATLRDAAGAVVGEATVRPVGDSVRLTLTIDGLPEGVRGAHIHETGLCDGPDFESAGDHWNPADVQHGLENPHGAHAGDMPNIEVGADGRGDLDYVLRAGDMSSLLDADGAAIIVHTDEDDQRTDPAGDSGDRIACGVFERGDVQGD